MAVATGRSGMISSGGPVAHQRVRTGPLVTTIALHVGVLAILLSQASEQLRPVERTLSVFSISASAEPLKQAPPKVPQPKLVKPTPPQPVIVPPPVVELPTPNDTVVAMLEQAADVATGGACDLTAPVQAALQSNEGVLAVGSGVWRWQDLLDTAVADGATMLAEGNGVSATLASRTSASLTMR